MWKFLRNEMMVILALTEDADRTDAEVADVFDLKKGTVSSVRRRLLEAGAIDFAYVPSFNMLGCEMLAFHHGPTDPAVRVDIKASHYMEFCNRAPQVYFGMLGGNSVAMFTALKNATELESFMLSHNKFFLGAKKASKASLSTVIFPFALSRGKYVPHFANIVYDYFELDVPQPKSRPPHQSAMDPVDLSRTEKEVLVAMVANPTDTDREIAAHVRLSRQAVTRIRNRLTGDGIITRICVPRLYRWGFEICAIAHPKFSLDISWEKRLRTEPKTAVETSFYSVSKADEAVSCYMVPKFTQYSERLESLLRWYHKMKAFDDELDLILFSLERTSELRNFDFAPAVSNILGTNPRSQ
jgi:DNA-binding Lrp family transcriptional regulator